MHRYEEYCANIQSGFSGSRYRFHRCLKHQGFALAVKIGLEMCSTEYALIAQHDRTMRIKFPYTEAILNTMDQHLHVRYVGFPSLANINHDVLLATQYNLSILNHDSSCRIDVSIPEHRPSALRLQPLIFWYDSQHLCHVSRYLEIYRPFANLPTELKREIGVKTIKKMILKKGDFIEDRFGQVQRDLLAEKGRVDPPLAAKMFRWYGSYLCWWTAEGLSVEEEEEEWGEEHAGASRGSPSVHDVSSAARNALRVGCSGAVAMVSHLRGRTFDPESRRAIEMSAEKGPGGSM